MQVVALLADGHRYRSIAECLSISPGQVHRHVRRSIDRLGVHSATELVAVAVADGIIPRPFEVRPPTTGSGKVEAFTTTLASGYQTGIASATRFSPGDADNGWFGLLG